MKSNSMSVTPLPYMACGVTIVTQQFIDRYCVEGQSGQEKTDLEA